ncbi:MAG: NUDIX hydrolase [Hyphomicrobiaceae bacterium]|nr:NUDIX hydrolase [Hyphomicrobiaceae bacterium]
MDGSATMAADVRRVARCRLTVAPYRWAFAEARAAEIAAHWDQQRAANPSYFNGTVLMLADYSIAGDDLVATAFVTEFRSYLFWRSVGFPSTGAIDGFGSAVIRASDGSLLLGRQRSGQLNAGLDYLPGGFIDSRDIDAHGRIDIGASVAREVAEETGLDLDELKVEPGFFVTRVGAQLSIGVPFRSALDGAALRRRVESHIASEPDGELVSVRCVATMADLADVRLAGYCVPLLPVLLGAEGGALG